MSDAQFTNLLAPTEITLTATATKKNQVFMNLTNKRPTRKLTLKTPSHSKPLTAVDVNNDIFTTNEWPPPTHLSLSLSLSARINSLPFTRLTKYYNKNLANINTGELLPERQKTH